MVFAVFQREFTRALIAFTGKHCMIEEEAKQNYKCVATSFKHITFIICIKARRNTFSSQGLHRVSSSILAAKGGREKYR